MYPSAAYLRAWTCTFVTSGQVASIVRSCRACAFSCTEGATPCAESTIVCPSGTSRLVLDEDRAALLELLHDVQVVDDLLADVDRRPVQLERPFDRLDRPLDSGAVAPRRCEEDLSHHLQRILDAGGFEKARRSGGRRDGLSRLMLAAPVQAPVTVRIAQCKPNANARRQRGQWAERPIFANNKNVALRVSPEITEATVGLSGRFGRARSRSAPPSHPPAAHRSATRRARPRRPRSRRPARPSR